MLQANKALNAEFFISAASNDEACEIASDLLEEADSPLIEVWHVGQRVFVVAKMPPNAEEHVPHADGARGAARSG